MCFRFWLVLTTLQLGWAVALVGSYVPAWSEWQVLLRLTSSILLVAMAWATVLEVRSWRMRGLAWGVAVGMTLGCQGDFAMAGLMTWLPLPSPVLGGMLFFGLGHLAYQAASEMACRTMSLPRDRRWWLAVLAWQAINLVAWGIVVYPASRHHDLIWPALAYGALLAGTAGVLSGLALSKRGCLPMAMGAALFLFSDLMIAVRLFQQQAWADPLVWATYGPGQMLIVFGAVLALTRYR